MLYLLEGVIYTFLKEILGFTNKVYQNLLIS